MKRLLAGCAVAILAVAALATPVLAWDAVAITITGGGSTISGHGGDVIDGLLVDVTTGTARPANLGPRYEIAYSLGGGAPIAVQDLYPYAEGGPVAYSSADGSLVGHPFRAGWRQARPELLQTFVSWGLPAAPPVGASASGTASPVGIPFALMIGVAAAALLGLVGAAVVAVARRPEPVARAMQRVLARAGGRRTA